MTKKDDSFKYVSYEKTCENDAKMRKKRAKMRKKMRKSGVEGDNLTQKEKEVLSSLTDDYLTPRQVALRRQIHISTVYRYIRKYEKLGLFSRKIKNAKKTNVLNTDFSHFKNFFVRLHGEEFNVKLLWKDHNYLDRIGKTILIDSNTIRCYKDSIEIYSGQHFYGNDEEEATRQSVRYWNRFFSRLENDLKVILIKSRKQNITLVKSHYAETNNEISRECINRGDKVRIYTTEDNKLWFTIDNSFNLYEAETQHRTTSKRDIGVVRKYFNDWRDNEPLTNTEIQGFMSQVVKQMKEQLEAQYNTQLQIKQIAETQYNTQVQIKQILDILVPINKKEHENENKNIISTEKPYYVG